MPDVPLRIDELGLNRVLSEWSGIGNLFRAVAEIADPGFERSWSSQDVEQRAMRILLLECSPILRKWPQSLRVWRDHIPALSVRTKFWSSTPETRVDWVRTRQTGWPPTSFAIRRRHRSTDQVTLTVLSWTLGRLMTAFSASQKLVGSQQRVLSELGLEVQVAIEQALPLLPLLDGANDTTPSRDDIRSVRGAGWPWKAVAEVAEKFLILDRGGAESLAKRLIRPDGFPEAIFQLSILGGVLNSCEQAGGRVVSLRPIGSMTNGPVYRVEWPERGAWDIWCEAAAAWSWYGLEDTYRDLTSGMTQASGAAFSARHIRPDILIAAPELASVVLECKYPADSLDPGYVGHGLYQALFYARQLEPAFPHVLGVSIGPAELVPTINVRDVSDSSLAIASAAAIPNLIAWLVEASNTASRSVTASSPSAAS